MRRRALKSAGTQLDSDITVMAIRAEESSWFNVSYLGSNGAFGLLDPACLKVTRSDTGRSLEATLLERGFDPLPYASDAHCMNPRASSRTLNSISNRVPTLVAERLPAAVVTGIRGCKRFRNARCIGQYAHSGAVSRPHRHDAVAATVALLHHLET